MDQTSQTLLIALVGIIVGWFALGNIYNVRHGNTVMQWMQAGLPKLGQKTTVQWRGSSVAELGLTHVKPPFKQVTLLMVLEPRDVPWLWLMTRSQKRHDMLIVRGQLVTPPPVDYDVYAPGSWSDQLTGRRGDAQNWKDEPIDELSLRASLSYQTAAREHATRALATARSISATIWRLSARRADQHFELHVPLPNPRTVDAERFFSAVRGLAEQLGKR